MGVLFMYIVSMGINKSFIIAEMSGNHNQSLKQALETIRAAKRAGADAIKIQTYTADTITLNCRKPGFMADSPWNGMNLYDLYKQAYTPWEWHKEIFHVACEEGLVCFSTPFDKTAVDLLESLSNPIYKISSFEITDIPLIQYVAAKHKPMIISTGIATIEDIELALKTCFQQGNYDITLLKCTSAYPAPVSDANLLMIPDMKCKFQVRVGISDHTIGGDVAVAAVALGAEVVEKHFIIDRSIGGPDSAFSMNLEEFTAMVNSIRNVEQALGMICYPTTPETIKGRQYCRSLYVAKDMKVGEIITAENVRSVRPGYGLHPKFLSDILGHHINSDLAFGTPFSLSYLAD